jgi:hypothetical protein
MTWCRISGFLDMSLLESVFSTENRKWLELGACPLA